MDNIEIYNNSAKILEDKLPPKIVSWSFILLILLIIVIIFSFVPFNVYKNYSATIIKEDDISYLILNLNKNDFPFNDEFILYIKDKKYDYDIVNIENNIVVLWTNLEGMDINNNLLDINILKDRTTIFKILKNKILKGLGK